ncbi:MAG: hypothetical protein HGB12_18120 [Bacteroidetes bacterium]|nr:hypothetical protein [Bacteroidota bacterium]
MKIKLKLTIRILFTLITFYFSFFTFHSFSQGIGINITGDSSNSKALLDIDAKNMSPKAGLLIPRMTTAERDAITTPIPESLLIYNTDTKCYEGYNATTATWVGFGCIGCTLPTAPSAGTNTPSQTEIIWNWNAVSGVTAYKWNTTNNYGTATDVGAVTSKTETSLSCNTAYTRYIWTYNNCGNSTATALTQTTSSCFSCGSPFSVTHTSGAVAPETKTVSYGTVTTSLSGASKCWITQNLGSTNQATSATDASDAAAGWYWQFNRKQGYKVGPTPAWTVTSINENSDWLADNDPCTIELGSGWRIPTQTEWTNTDANGQSGGWDNYNEAFADVLKLHAAGVLDVSNGALCSRGSMGGYWSSKQDNNTYAWYFYIDTNYSYLDSFGKAYGRLLRCIKD